MQELNQSTVFIAAMQDEQPMASVEIYGHKECVLGDNGVLSLGDDSLFYSKRQVFGFPLVEQLPDLTVG